MHVFEIWACATSIRSRVGHFSLFLNIVTIPFNPRIAQGEVYDQNVSNICSYQNKSQV